MVTDTDLVTWRQLPKLWGQGSIRIHFDKEVQTCCSCGIMEQSDWSVASGYFYSFYLCPYGDMVACIVMLDLLSLICNVKDLWAQRGVFLVEDPALCAWCQGSHRSGWRQSSTGTSGTSPGKRIEKMMLQ